MPLCCLAALLSASDAENVALWVENASCEMHDSVCWSLLCSTVLVKSMWNLNVLQRSLMWKHTGARCRVLLQPHQACSRTHPTTRCLVSCMRPLHTCTAALAAASCMHMHRRSPAGCLGRSCPSSLASRTAGPLSTAPAPGASAAMLPMPAPVRTPVRPLRGSPQSWPLRTASPQPTSPLCQSTSPCSSRYANPTATHITVPSPGLNSTPHCLLVEQV